MLSIVYGLASAVSWGTGDFVGGFAAKKSNLFAILLVGHIASVVLLTLWAIGSGIVPPSMFHMALGALAGVANVFGLTALFKGLAAQSGRLDISAVIGAMYPATTVLLAWIFLKEGLSKKQWIGAVAAIAAIALIVS